MMSSGSLGQGRLPGVPVYGVPFHLFLQMPWSRQMQSPPHWLVHRPPTPPTCTDAVLCADKVVEEERAVEVLGGEVMLEAGLVEVLDVLGEVCGGSEVSGGRESLAEVEAPAAPASTPPLPLLPEPLVVPRPAPKPIAIAAAIKPTDTTMKKVFLFRPKIIALFPLPTPVSAPSPAPHASLFCSRP